MSSPEDDPHETSRHKLPFSPSHEKGTYLPLKPRRLLWNTYLLIALVVFHLGCDAAVIWVSLHTFRLGSNIAEDRYPISNNHVVALINAAAKVLCITSTTIAGWAASHLFSRRLSKPGSTAGLAELHSLTIFQSIPTIYTSMGHLLSGRYISARWLYGSVITTAVLLQVYSIAVSALLTPTLAETTKDMTQSVFLHPYMHKPIIGARCHDDTCLGITLSGSALADVEAYRATPDVSMAVSTFITPSVIYAFFPMMPINKDNPSDGILLYGTNVATIASVVAEPPWPWSPPTYDSLSFSATVVTQVPLLKCHCHLGPQNNSGITHDQHYSFTKPIYFRDNGSIAGQLTEDNKTLILSFPHSHPGSVEIDGIAHCSVQLRFRARTLEFDGSPAPFDAPFFDPSLVVFASVDAQATDTAHWEHQSTLEDLYLFAKIWLGGLGWSDRPVASPIVGSLQKAPIATDGGPEFDEPSLEHLILVMLANGISGGFFEEVHTGDDSDSVFDNRTYTIQKTQFFVGISRDNYLQRFLLFVVFLDSAFVLLCLFVILRDGWYPNLSNPVTLAQVALCSSPPGASSDASPFTDPGDPSRLADNPIPLEFGSSLDPRLWKEEFSLMNVASGGRNYLVFRTKSQRMHDQGEVYL